MDIQLDGGLNLNDPATLQPNELVIATNADFRKKGVVRVRDGRTSIYTSQGTTLIGSADGDLYSLGSDVYRNGTALGASVTGATSIGVTKLRNVDNEVLLFSAQANYKVDDSSVQTWGIVAPSVAPTLALAAGGSLSVGNYYYKYTYVRKSGSTLIHESNPSPVSAVVAPSGGNLSVTVTCTASTDTQVTHIRVYRTLVGGSSTSNDFLYDIEITIPTVVGTSTQADTALGALVETDNNPPPSTGLTAIAGPGAYNVIFIASGNEVFFSKAGRPESFPSVNYFPVGVPIQTIRAIIDWGGLIYLFNRSEVYYLQGTTPDTFYPVRTMASRGLAAAHAIKATEKGILYLSFDGVYAFNGQAEVKLTGDKVDSIFRGETVGTALPINKSALTSCWLEYWNGKMFLGYPTSTNTQPDKVLVYDFEQFKFSIYDYGRTLVSAFVDIANNRLLAGDSNGTIWQLESGANDAGTAISFNVRSKELAGLNHTSPNYLRVDVTNPTNNSVAIALLHGNVIEYTRTVTTSEDSKKQVLPPRQYDKLQLDVNVQATGRVAIGQVQLT